VTIETIPPGSQLALTATPGQIELTEWVARASSAHALMSGLVDSFFVPAAYKPTGGANGREIAIANGVGAILLGQSIGVDPLTALQNIYIVHGRPGMYAKFKVALCQSRGHEIWTDERTDESVTVSGRSRGSERIHTITITMDMATRAGWTSNPAYKKTPQDMLWSRAAGRVSDMVGGSALFGIASIEDLEDGPDDRVRTITRVTAKDVQKRALLGAAKDEPATAPATAAEAKGEDDPGAPMLDARQWDAINRRFVELEVVGDGQKAARLTVISRIVDRPITRGGELTATEGQMVLDNLAGNLGFEVVGQALGTSAAAGPVTDEDGQDDDATDPAEPTEQEWDAMGGAEAEAEADRG